MERYLRSKVIEILNKLDKATFEDLISEMLREGLVPDDVKLRKVIADLIREGIIVKRPNPKKMKLEYTLSSRSYPEDKF